MRLAAWLRHGHGERLRETILAIKHAWSRSGLAAHMRSTARLDVAPHASPVDPKLREEDHMPDFEIRSFNHTAFTVSDLDEVIPFFRDLLGFELTSRAPRDPRLIQRMTAIGGADVEIAYVNGPAHRIELIEYKAPADRGVIVPRLCDSGAAHVALDVRGIEALVAASEAYGFTAVGEIIEIDAGPNQGSKVVYLRGPDGITVEYIEPAR
jgi:catechol 2,3-dioxygenase-like lactoylglutathione lyase family enzyme